MSPAWKDEVYEGDEDLPDGEPRQLDPPFPALDWGLAPTAKQVAVMAVVDMAIDLSVAIRKATRDGTLTPIACAVLYLRFHWDLTLDEIGELLHMSARSAKRILDEALDALHGTGVLDVYDE